MHNLELFEKVYFYSLGHTSPTEKSVSARNKFEYITKLCHSICLGPDL